MEKQQADLAHQQTDSRQTNSRLTNNRQRQTAGRQAADRPAAYRQEKAALTLSVSSSPDSRQTNSLQTMKSSRQTQHRQLTNCRQTDSLQTMKISMQTQHRQQNRQLTDRQTVYRQGKAARRLSTGSRPDSRHTDIRQTGSLQTIKNNRKTQHGQQTRRTNCRQTDSLKTFNGTGRQCKAVRKFRHF